MSRVFKILATVGSARRINVAVCVLLVSSFNPPRIKLSLFTWFKVIIRSIHSGWLWIEYLLLRMLVTCLSERSPVRVLTSFNSPSTTLHWHLASVVSRSPGYERRRSNAAATSAFGSTTCAFWSKPVASKFISHDKCQSSNDMLFCCCYRRLRDVTEVGATELLRKWRLPIVVHQKSRPFQPIRDSRLAGFRSKVEWANTLAVSGGHPIGGSNSGRRKRVATRPPMRSACAHQYTTNYRSEIYFADWFLEINPLQNCSNAWKEILIMTELQTNCVDLLL